MLLVTPGRSQAIENIRRAAAEGRFNDKTEPFDPEWSPEALKADIARMDEQIRKLSDDRDSLERFARENYGFAAPDEDVYVLK